MILIAILLVSILVLLNSGSRVASNVIKPNGTDDTAGIQAALDSCVGAGPGCTVQLAAGTFHVSQIAVTGFHGSLVGTGPSNRPQGILH